ncbi:DNA polymerase-3 subunit gamma/tau [Epsilonproteobacteria bacterium SCGC AD-308-P11]|nr:DNA polymerase-3 subunit gamma/tau [Epsilonproteobacteria bacterium SCGC AD-308-P11]
MKESSEVLARKYRPSNFDELIGQETIAQTLSLALDSNRLSHAYLFSGLRGSGKTSTARIFAKALICEKGMTHQPCGVCQNCILSVQNRHMDIVEMDGASSRKIDDIRDLIEQTKYKPSSARFKIFIIDEVHMLTKEAFNALLKTLEEPPSYVKFILATTDPLKLPATILSRTQHFRFKSIATNKIVDHLAHILHLEKIEYETNALEILARSGNGSLRDTLTLLDQAIIYSKNHVDVLTVTDMLGLVDPKFVADLFSAVFAKDYGQLVQYTKVLEDYEAEMVVDELIAYLKERMYNQDALFSTLVLDRFFRILSDSKYLFSINADGSFVLSLIFFKMIEALRIKEVEQMIESLQKEMHRPELSTKTVKKEIVHEEPKQENITQEKPAEQVLHVEVQEPAMQAVEAVNNENKLFDELVHKIQDRSSEIGACFTKSISFISYENDVLTWESCADDVCKNSLKHGYGVIKQFVREIYGFTTKIKNMPCSKEEKKNDLEVQATKQEEQKPHVQQPSMDEIQSTSMIEDAEIGGSQSCIASCSQSDESTKEINSADIKDEPMVQKAIEMFEATKVTIQSKI